jgi:hypothetical protein
VKTVCQKNNIKGSFDNIDTLDECRCEVEQAARYIAQKVHPTLPDLCAYPYGPSSDFIKRQYFPGFMEQHRTLAAFGANGGFLTKDSFRWNLPRLVFGALPPVGWRTVAELREVLHAVE